MKSDRRRPTGFSVLRGVAGSLIKASLTDQIPKAGRGRPADASTDDLSPAGGAGFLPARFQISVHRAAAVAPRH